MIDVHELLSLGDAALGDRNRLVLLVELVVEVGDKVLLGPGVHPLRSLAGNHLRSEARELAVGVTGGFGRA
uniref:Unannotated protein n=1 Tax=freshwater metagenome TaxID=449393 RepID=A0A6J6A1E8_9ZZZZ